MRVECSLAEDTIKISAVLGDYTEFDFPPNGVSECRNILDAKDLESLKNREGVEMYFINDYYIGPDDDIDWNY